MDSAQQAAKGAPAAPAASAGRVGAPEEILIRGAREHNLRGFDLRIPRDQLVVITGPSGSGKSSLAFDTLYAEGQRRYVESLSAYARQFLDQMSRPDVESIDGLSPAISIEQRTISRSPRSTVGTATEISDYLRLLFARVGTPHCHECGKPISQQSVDQMCQRVLSLNPGARVQVMAPVVRGRKGEYRKELERFHRKGFVRVRVDGHERDLAEPIPLKRTVKHNIELVVDRIIVKPAARDRLTESIVTALKLGEGLVVIDIAEHAGEEAREWLLSKSNACVDCGISFPEIAPRMFSFNNPHGACPECGGLGQVAKIEPERVVPDEALSLAGGAIAPWKDSKARYYRELLESLAAHYEVDLATPWGELPRRVRQGILLGSGRKKVLFSFTQRGRREQVTRAWHGVADELKRRGEEDEKAYKRLEPYRRQVTCPECKGARLGLLARQVRIEQRAIHELNRLPISELRRFLAELRLEGTQGEVALRIVREIADRLRFLCEVGLEYLTLDRSSATLSGGEAQRIRLATQIGASLLGVLYILDEPSIGLHARDHARLLESLKQLRDMGNSVVVVEHDEATIRAADCVIDMGPGAGLHGGDIVAQGPPGELPGWEANEQAASHGFGRHAGSLTGAYLRGERAIPIPAPRRPTSGPALEIKGCTAHNLKGVDLRIPLSCLTVVTGVSGSGKSSLISDTLHPALSAQLHGGRKRAGPYRAVSGVHALDKVIDVDQAPIGRSPRSNPATYSGAFSGIRQLFSQVPEARVRGYGPGRFSFNVKGGRCEACQGDGSLRVEMHFVPDLFVTCQACNGRRYNRETLEIRYRGRNIADLLEMSVEEAVAFLENTGSLQRSLQALKDVGLGYIHLGQAANTLSGGEAQRVKLARELARRSTGKTLYLLDEPTTGLHFADVEKLLELLGQLIDRGNTVVVIEHHLDVVKCADHVVDLGPEGGEAGGEIVVQGTPEEVSRCEFSHTGAALRPVLAP